MRKTLFCLACATALCGPYAYASNVDFNVGINIGNRPTVIEPAPPPPVYVPVQPQPVYDAPPVIIDEAPVFIQPPQLGFYVAVGVPHDLFYVSGQYYLSRGNVWYSAPYYNGPWVAVRHRALPRVIRRHPHEKIRYYRDSGYAHYRRGGDPYWERHRFHPKDKWKEHRKAEREDWKRARHEEKEYRKHGGKHGRDD